MSAIVERQSIEMELAREDGAVLSLKEGERHELGRGSGFDAEGDQSVSRLHVIVELLRPASRKGKEVVGKSTALKLHVHVVGRNPICIITNQGAEDRNPAQIKFAGKGEIVWLVPGDKFALSIRWPVFFNLRQHSSESWPGDEVCKFLSAGITSKPIEYKSSSPFERSVTNVELDILKEEEGIARAVARRQRRRLEKDVEQQRMRLSEQQQSQNSGLDNPDRIKPVAENHEKVSGAPARTNHGSRLFDPVSDFGFIVKGLEFQVYEERSKTEKKLEWNWKFDKKGENREVCLDEKGLHDKTERSSRNSGINSWSEEEDEEWEDGNEEEHLSTFKGPNGESMASTLLSGSNISKQKRKNPQTLNTELSNIPGQASEDNEDSKRFFSTSNIIKDEDDKNEYQNKDDLIDDNMKVSRQTEKRLTHDKKQTPACRYGSNCYRENKEHLKQFSHPNR